MDDAALRAVFARDRFAAHAGIEILDTGPGRARACLEIQPHHLNGMDVVQGGAIFTLADFAFALAANSHGVKTTGLSAAVHWLRPVRAGRLVAEAAEVSCARRIATYSVRITDSEGALVATFHGTGYRLADSWDGSARPDVKA